MIKNLFWGLLMAAFGLPSAAQAADYQLSQYLFNNAGNTQTAYHPPLTQTIIHSNAVGETLAGQTYGGQYSIQAGYFNDYYFDKPTPTVTPTRTVTPTMTITGTPLRTFGGELLDKQFVYPAPHPIRGAYANLYWHLAEAAKVKVKIYTTGNQLVIAKDFGWQSAGKNYWHWHVANLANGPYIMLITADNGKKKTRVIKKLAIIK